MDEITRKRLEQIDFRESESDHALMYVQCFHKEKLENLSLTDVINYVYRYASKGVSRLRVKELLIRDLIDPLVFENQDDVDIED